MFALRLDFLSGRYVSQRYDDRTRPEWPPHPARLFFGLAAVHFETGEDPNERSFLEWFEALPPPDLVASEADFGPPPLHYVPVNDDPPRQRLLSLLPEHRVRHGRTFPAAWPWDPVVYFVWPQVELPASLKPAAERLLGQLSYLGHSSSPVALSPVASVPSPTWIPIADGGTDLVLRVTFPGHLEALRRSFERYQRSGVRGALPAVPQSYRRLSKDPPHAPLRSTFGSMVVFRRRSGSSLPITAAPLAAQALRRALLAVAREPIPEILSGHRPDGSPTDRPHVAFVALPDVGHPHADGHLMGLAAVLPREMEPEERRLLLQSLGSLERLAFGRAGSWLLERTGVNLTSRALWPATWTGPASRWTTVTPILLDRFPKSPFGSEAVDLVREACRRTGLPEPVALELSSYSDLVGVPPTFAFLPARSPDEHRPLVHATLVFARPVEGPVLLGAGRYRGWGLLRPSGGFGGSSA